jgi:hypothetical protein
VHAIVFCPVCSIDSCVSVSFAVCQRASTVSEPQARSDTSNNTGNAPLLAELPASFTAATRTSTSPEPISSVALVAAVVVVGLPSTYRMYDVAPLTASQENSPVVAERRVKASATGAVAGPPSHVAPSATQTPDAQQT